ncbi:ferredoxin-NADP reductase [Reichenbachiella ulvae]|uniref:Ferredoxin-NADP reductase n=1 Tax=Reichenbachiella ulvae TaxID=2980104 RepID=A0ABT3CUI9_9BACT|nr:ferredoxin-NADP reductase [Reichenbachiella ulvae]MCV9387284.1 ferredoxin-NADP reductase [Reichenbachiella ulvae]
MAHLEELDKADAHLATVMHSERLTPVGTEEVREILLEVEDPNWEPKIDQSFGVLINYKGQFGNKRHHRLYSVADLPKKQKTSTQIKVLVKRCNYVDEFNGELYHGVASNYLCDRHPGDQITITGPHELPFEVPEDKNTDLILIGMGTGIAPFRAFVKHIYHDVKDWKGKIRLFYGAKSGLELLYLNEKDGDLTNYYDQETFMAFHALSPRPHMKDDIPLAARMEERADEILEMLNKVNTRVYVAGYDKVYEQLDIAFSNILGSYGAWQTRKAELIAGNRWREIIY